VGGTDKKAELVANAYTFALTADTTVAVTYEAIPATQYTLTLSGTGLTSVPGAGAMDENTSVTATLAPAEGYQVATFTVGGTDKKAELVANAYTFALTADTTVAVTYEAIPVTLSSIAITTPATKLVYTVGDTLDITGMVVTGTYGDASKVVETITAANVTDFDSTAVAASQPLTVTFGGKTATYTVAIQAVPVTYTVTFDSQGGSAVAAITGITSGATVTLPTAPTKTGYTFNGWFTAITGGTAFTALTPVITDVIVYAQWTGIYISVPTPIVVTPTPIVVTPTPIVVTPTPVLVKKPLILILQIDNTMFWNNSIPTKLDSTPVIKNSRTLLPLRAIIEALAGTVTWDPIEHKVTVTLGNKTLMLWIGKDIATVNGVSIPIDATDIRVVPEIINGRTMLPLRFVAENLGATVGWDPKTQTIKITYTP